MPKAGQRILASVHKARAVARGETSKGRGRVARDETFDEFLYREGMLAETEDLALKEIIADQLREAIPSG